MKTRFAPPAQSAEKPQGKPSGKSARPSSCALWRLARSWLALGALVCANLWPCAGAQTARVSEPSTTIYGRVFQRVGAHDFPITEGELRWTIAGTQLGGRQYQLKANLSSLGQGRYSYALRIPHQLLAYDLAPNPKAVPLTAAPTRFRHLNVTVNGIPATLVAPAVDGLTADQSTRAATYRIDLDVSNLSPDSDGDGIPDWWEDKYGTDKWNPNDGSFTPPVTATQPELSELNVSLFAQWRALYFPGDLRDIGLFAVEDPDKDQVVNVLEYAFGLNPLKDDSTRPWLPVMRREDGKVTLEYGVRRKATDLDYVIEISPDLFSWRKATPEETKTTVNSTDPAFDRAIVELLGAAQQDQSYLRVRVNRIP